MLDSGYKPDTITYSTLVAACNREDNLEQALLVSQEMEGRGIKPNQVWNIFYELLGSYILLLIEAKLLHVCSLGSYFEFLAMCFMTVRLHVST